MILNFGINKISYNDQVQLPGELSDGDFYLITVELEPTEYYCAFLLCGIKFFADIISEL